MHYGEDSLIEAQNISFSYNGNVALRNVTFSVGNEFMVIMGPNGSGKTTLVKIIMGLLKPHGGTIKVFGKSPERVRDKIGYMPQKENIARHFPIRAIDVVLMGISSKKFIGKEEIKKARNALREVGLEYVWNKPFGRLSGGQQQRIMFARAIAKEPSLIIMDEPFNGVDLPSREKIMNALIRRMRAGTAVVAVLHNINPVLHYVNKVLLLNKEMIAFGKPNEVLTESILQKAYGGSVSVVVCEEGYCHPLIGDTHG